MRDLRLAGANAVARCSMQRWGGMNSAPRTLHAALDDTHCHWHNVCHRGNDGGMALVVLWDGKFCTEGG